MKSAWNVIRGLEPLSLCDWPGRVCAVLFFGGCNLKCPHCHNAGLAWAPERFPCIREQDVRTFLKARAPWLDGLVISGGEPTLTPGLAAFTRELSSYGPPVKIDTNGMRPDVVEEILIEAPDTYFSVDVKAPFEKYPSAVGDAVTPQGAREAMTRIFELAASHPGRFMFRATLVPEIDLADAQSIREALPSGHELILQDFRPAQGKRNIANKGRSDAETDQKTRRLSGNVVNGTYRPGHSQGSQGQRHTGSLVGPQAGAQGRAEA